jgi:hypothetical protein
MYKVAGSLYSERQPEYLPTIQEPLLGGAVVAACYHRLAVGRHGHTGDEAAVRNGPTDQLPGRAGHALSPGHRASALTAGTHHAAGDVVLMQRAVLADTEHKLRVRRDGNSQHSVEVAVGCPHELRQWQHSRVSEGQRRDTAHPGAPAPLTSVSKARHCLMLPSWLLENKVRPSGVM